MQSPKPTTPPWRRTPTLAHVATQIPPATRPQSNAIHKRQVCCAFLTTRPALSVSERGSAVLHARISYPHTIVTEAHAAHHLPQQLWSQNRRHAGLEPATANSRPSWTPTLSSARTAPWGAGRSKGQGRRSRRGSRAFAFGPRAASGRTASAHLREQSAACAPPASQAHQHKLQAGGLRSNRARLAGGTAAKKVFSTPHSFAPCGAYSRGRPHAQEEDDRKAAHHLAIGAARRRIARSITQLEQHAKKNAPGTE
jgi:hypothetical protein